MSYGSNSYGTGPYGDAPTASCEPISYGDQVYGTNAYGSGSSASIIFSTLEQIVYAVQEISEQTVEPFSFGAYGSGPYGDAYPYGGANIPVNTVNDLLAVQELTAARIPNPVVQGYGYDAYGSLISYGGGVTKHVADAVTTVYAYDETFRVSAAENDVFVVQETRKIPTAENIVTVSQTAAVVIDSENLVTVQQTITRIREAVTTIYAVQAAYKEKDLWTGAYAIQEITGSVSHRASNAVIAIQEIYATKIKHRDAETHVRVLQHIDGDASQTYVHQNTSDLTSLLHQTRIRNTWESRK